jgi:hypothetical protein
MGLCHATQVLQVPFTIHIFWCSLLYRHAMFPVGFRREVSRLTWRYAPAVYLPNLRLVSQLSVRTAHLVAAVLTPFSRCMALQICWHLIRRRYPAQRTQRRHALADRLPLTFIGLYTLLVSYSCHGFSSMNVMDLSLVLVCSGGVVILSGFLLVSFDLPLQCPLRAVIRGHPTLGGLITMMGNSDIFRHGVQELVLIAGVDAEFEPIHLRPIG